MVTMTDKACNSPTQRADARVTRKRVIMVRVLMCDWSRDSKGGDVSALGPHPGSMKEGCRPVLES